MVNTDQHSLSSCGTGVNLKSTNSPVNESFISLKKYRTISNGEELNNITKPQTLMHIIFETAFIFKLTNKEEGGYSHSKHFASKYRLL